MVNLFFGKILLEGVSCCVPKKAPAHGLRPPQPLEGVFCQSLFLEAQSGCTEVVRLGLPTQLAVAAFPQGRFCQLRTGIRELWFSPNSPGGT